MTTQKQIAEHLDLNQSEVSRLMAELAIDWKTVPLDAIRVAYVRRLRAAASGHQSRVAALSTRSAPGKQSVAPQTSAMTTSEMDASKLSDANWRTRLPGATPNAAAWARARFAKPRCVFIAPLGLPVEPEV